jgi:outer membrane lipoprotein-sorting protein
MVSFCSNLAARKLTVLVLGLILLLAAGSGVAADPVVSRWLNAQTNIQSWTADVTQIRRLKTLTQPLTATGHVWFAAPNQFRWEIGKPAQTIALRTADEMLVIYPRLKRAERYSFSGQQTGPWKDTLALLEAGFPRNETDLNKQFRIVNSNSASNVMTLDLEPRSAAGRRMMPRLSISFSTEDYMLRATELQFADGSTMRNVFTNPILNPKIEPSLFEPGLPPDYTTVEPMKQ